MQVKASEAISIISACFQAQLVPLLRGSPGSGKSDIFRTLAKKFNLLLIDIRLAQCDPPDMVGFPYINGGKAEYAPMAHFPVEGDPLPVDEHGNQYEGWLLFLDEITSAPPAIQAAAYKLILDRMVGNKRLHPRCVIGGAGNHDTDNAIVMPMSTAMESRMVHLDLMVDVNEWIKWAQEKGLDYFITDYVAYQPGMLYTFDPNHTDHTYACPRTWEMADRAIKVVNDYKSPILMPLLAGTISEGVAAQYLTYTEIYDQLPRPKEIISNPETVMIPEGPSVLYALTGYLSHNADWDNYAQYMKFITRLPIEFQAVTIRETVRRNPKMYKHPSIIKWTETSDSLLFET